MRAARILAAIIAASFAPLSASHAEELGVVTINPDQTLAASLFDPATAADTPVTSNFGAVGAHVFLGPLTSPGSVEIGAISIDASGAPAAWRIIDRVGEPAGELVFGAPGAIFAAGGDFDGDGIIDPAAIEVSGRALKWRIRPGAFTAAPGSEITRTYGAKLERSRVFFANIDGSKDRLGTVRKLPGRPAAKPRYQLRLLDVVTGAQRAKMISSIGAITSRPIPVKRGDGIDLLAFTKALTGGLLVTVVKPNGHRHLRKTFTGEGTLVVGDFDPADPGDELGWQRETTLTIFNPNSRAERAVAAPAGIYVDTVNLNSFSEAPSGPAACGGAPGVCGCNFLDETDGYKIGFVYKARSDTYGGIVAVLPNQCGRSTTGVSVLDGSCAVVDSLDDNGYGNPDGTGVRHHFKKRDASRTGGYYQQTYGSIILKLEGTDACFRIENPGQSRID